MSDPDFDLIARYYDLIYQNRDEDLMMWDALAEETGGPVLEIGCGTGRLTLPLLSWGYTVTGIDVSAAALAILRQKMAAANLTGAELVAADMRDFDLPANNFRLAAIPVNTFMHNLTIADQMATLQSVHRHLAPDGLVVIDLYQPQPQALLEADGRMMLADEFRDEATGHLVQWFVSRRLQLDEQLQDVTFFLDELTAAGKLTRQVLNFGMRYLHRFEMEHLLLRCGFQVVDILGDYYQALLAPDSPRMIFIAQKMPETGH